MASEIFEEIKKKYKNYCKRRVFCECKKIKKQTNEYIFKEFDWVKQIECITYKTKENKNYKNITYIIDSAGQEYLLKYYNYVITSHFIFPDEVKNYARV